MKCNVLSYKVNLWTSFRLEKVMKLQLGKFGAFMTSTIKRLPVPYKQIIPHGSTNCNILAGSSSSYKLIWR